MRALQLKWCSFGFEYGPVPIEPVPAPKIPKLSSAKMMRISATPEA
jgi:hypothetical protein